MAAITTPISIRDAARAAWSSDQAPAGVSLEKVEIIGRLVVLNLARNAHFNEGEPLVVDLANGFLMSCTVGPVEATN